MKKQEFKFILGNGSEGEVIAENLSSALGSMSLGDKLKLHKRIIEEKGRSKKSVEIDGPAIPLVDESAKVVAKAEPAQEQQGPTPEQIAEFESIMKRREELDAQIKALEEEIQKELEGTQGLATTSLEETKEQRKIVKGEPEDISQPIELSIDLPEGYKLEKTTKNS